jgi:hypothetical protein
MPYRHGRRAHPCGLGLGRRACWPGETSASRPRKVRSSREPAVSLEAADGGAAGAVLARVSGRGRDRRKLQFAVLAAAAMHGGAEPDLLDEVAWWPSDDFWQYARLAAAACFRAAGDRAGMPARQVREQPIERLPGEPPDGPDGVVTYRARASFRAVSMLASSVSSVAQVIQRCATRNRAHRLDRGAAGLVMAISEPRVMTRLSCRQKFTPKAYICDFCCIWREDGQFARSLAILSRLSCLLFAPDCHNGEILVVSDMVSAEE